MTVAVVIPTVTGREAYLRRCLRGYHQRTVGHDVRYVIVADEATCGIAWQKGADIALEDRSVSYLHLTADDIVPGEGWLAPLIDVVNAGAMPCALVVTAIKEQVLGLRADEPVAPDSLPLPGNPLSSHSMFYEGVTGPDVIADGAEAHRHQYPSVPFMSLAQWRHVGPMIASHYGTDKWAGDRARDAGIKLVACRGAVFYHYVAAEGRAPIGVGWLHTDRLSFDMNVSYPLYRSGALDPRTPHPERDTAEGRRMARAWHAANVPPPFPWDCLLPGEGEEYR